jgi:hypothetical protein
MIRKDNQLEFLVPMVETTRNGTSFISTKLKLLQLRVSMKTSVSTSTDHSTSFQDSHNTESLKLLEQTILSSRHMQREDLDNNSTSIMFPRLSDLSNGRTMLWKSKAMVDHLTLE